MKFEDVYGRWYGDELSQADAAEILGMSERTFRRYRDRFEADGAEGLYDRRLGRVSARRVPVDTVMEVLELFDTRYFDFTAKHFWDKLVARARFYPELQLAAADAAGARADQAGGAARGAPTQAPPAPDGRHDAASRRLQPGLAGSGGI
jgi:hypothetical protein